MRELRLLRQDEGSATLIFGNAEDDEQFVLAVDDMIRAAVLFDVAHAKARPSVEPRRPPAPSITVSPREIQTRVRAGEPPQALADQYGVDLDRIMRFAGAVLEERIRVAAEARRSRARRGPGDGRTVNFGDYVEKRFAGLGLDGPAVTWDAHRRSDGEWIVQAAWTLDDESRSAEWIFHRSTRFVTPVDQLAAELLSDQPLRPTGVRAALAPGVVAFPPMPDAHTGPIPVIDEVFDQEDTLDQPRTVPAAVPAVAPAAVPAVVPVAAVTADTADELRTPPLPLSINENNRARKRPNGSRQTRSKVPSWDDIMLGVRPKTE